MKNLPYEVNFSVAGDTQYVAYLCSVISSVAGEVGEEIMSQEIQRKCRLALVEAVNNAVVHAHNGDVLKPVGIKVQADKDGIEINVIDYGPGFKFHHAQLPDMRMVHGRGLFIIQSLMDEVNYNRGKDKNIMVMKCKRK